MTSESLQTEPNDRNTEEAGMPSGIAGTPESETAGAENERASREWRRFYETVKEITQGLRD